VGSHHQVLPQTLGVSTPVAKSGQEVIDLAASSKTLAILDARVSVCRACPRLVSWREEVAVQKRRAFIDEEYWGRPVTGFGPADAQIVIVGLAPAAHGGNRTGRVFTGDESGNWLFASLHRVGLAKTPTSISSSDDQELLNTRLLAAVRCAPPANAPTTEERDTCRPWFAQELALLTRAYIFVALGGFAWDALLTAFTGIPKPKPKFAHGAKVELPDGRILLASYHPSQQNTYTGRLTEVMLDDVLGSAARLVNR
jgi:uracil-DNA glycosylase family 4